MISSIEFFMYRISDLLLAPVLLAILFVFFFGFYSLGQVAMQAWQRRAGQAVKSNRGYELHHYQAIANPHDFDELELFAFKRLEFLKLVTKVAPMLGLIATMIPMGPALKSLADGNVQGISENLSIAFAAVIFALAAASLTFVALSIKKRWLAQDLVDLKHVLDSQQTPQVSLKAVKEA
ncbi:MAG: biopolymer transport protein ExbB/TolQ [Oceanicoccus sp.]|jgi:biopolymer transport protein ExbB/TolQ